MKLSFISSLLLLAASVMAQGTTTTTTTTSSPAEPSTEPSVILPPGGSTATSTIGGGIQPTTAPVSTTNDNPGGPPPPGPLQKLEPANGKLILGAWLYTEDEPEGRDNPLKFNTRLGYNAGSFQMAQSIPLAPNPYEPGKFLDANMTLLNEGTDATLFLTICEYNTLGCISSFVICQWGWVGEGLCMLCMHSWILSPSTYLSFWGIKSIQ
jgi:hypothetical protein